MDALALNQWVSLEKRVYNRPLNSKLISRVIKTHYYTVWQANHACFRYLFQMNNCRYLEDS